MNERSSDYGHLGRFALLFVAGAVAFMVLRAVFIPAGFGDLGHYRSGALEDNREHRPSFAGQAACAECHEDALETKSRGKHAGVRCEACHGALAAHASDPTAAAASKPAVPDLCVVCHGESVSRPAGFPQVDPVEHAAGEACTACHAPHAPAVS
jgi:hypothetical protein